MLNFLLGKFLIISIKNYAIVDLFKPGSKYELLTENVPNVGWPVGGLIQNSPLVCGGYDNHWEVLQDCVVIGQPTMDLKMLEKRSEAACVVLNRNTLWIVGGNRWTS